MRGKSYFKNVLSEAEDMYSNASGRRSAFRGQTGGVGGGTSGGAIGGCTDVTASNFLPQATCDDGSCDYSNYGCTQTWADNYDPSAMYEDGSCVGDISDLEAELYSQQYAQPSDPIPYNICPSFGGGCMVDFAINFNAEAVYEDGSCLFDDGVYPIHLTWPSPYDGGCPDPSANNYDADADYNDGLCDYSGTLSAGGGFPCGFPTPNQGCTDSRAVNYDPSACFDNGTCSFSGVYAEVYSNEYTSNLDQCVNVCTTSSGGSTSGGGIVDSAFGTGKDPKYQSKRKRRGMRSATGGGKRSVGTAVNWLTPLI